MQKELCDNGFWVSLCHSFLFQLSIFHNLASLTIVLGWNKIRSIVTVEKFQPLLIIDLVHYLQLLSFVWLISSSITFLEVGDDDGNIDWYWQKSQSMFECVKIERNWKIHVIGFTLKCEGKYSEEHIEESIIKWMITFVGMHHTNCVSSWNYK